MSKFLREIQSEIQIRIRTYKQEKVELAKAADRMLELDDLIAEAQGELETLSVRIPKENKEDVPTDSVDRA